MSDLFKISGQRVELPGASNDWKVTTRPGGWIIAERVSADGSIERRRFLVQEQRGRLSALLSGTVYTGEVANGRERGGAAGGSDADLIAQFPGKVRKLLVKSGDEVEAGAPLLLVEAMKMEFPVKAPFAGRVTQVRVKEGQQLSPGDRFLDLEELKK